MLFLELEYNNNTSTKHSMRTQFNIGTEIILKEESKTNEFKEKEMEGKTDYMEEEQGKARVGAQQLFIYTLYIQQTDVFFCIYISILYSIYLLLLLLLLLSKIFLFLNIFDKKYFRKKKF